jgi:hypothetical protein
MLTREALGPIQGTEVLQSTSLASSVQVTTGEPYPAHLHEVCNHDDAGRVFLPDHSPKVLYCLLHGTCK